MESPLVTHHRIANKTCMHPSVGTLLQKAVMCRAILCVERLEVVSASVIYMGISTD